MNKDIQLLENFLRSNFPNDVLMPSCDKTPLLKHAEKRYDWDDWDKYKKRIGQKLHDNRVFREVGILLRDIFVIDIDPDNEGVRTYQELYDDFAKRFPFVIGAPMETTKRGCHIFFKRTPYCDEKNLATSVKPTNEYFDIKTITNKEHVIDEAVTRTRSLVVVAPSPNRTWVNPIWETCLNPIPESFVDYVINNTRKMSRGKGKVTLQKEMAVPKGTNPYSIPKELIGVDIRTLVKELLVRQKHNPMVVNSVDGNKVYLKNPDGCSHVCPNKQCHKNNNAEIYLMPDGRVLYKCYGATAKHPYRNERCDGGLYDFGRWQACEASWHNRCLIDDNDDEKAEREELEKKRDATLQVVKEAMYPTKVPERVHYKVYNERYVRPLDIDEDEHSTILKSHLGTGKTKQIRDYLEKTKPKSVLILSPRIIFASSIYLDFKKVLPNLNLYYNKPKGKPIDDPFVVCQMESIWRLSSSYEVIVCDESESNLTQFRSSTMQANFEKCVETFQRLVKEAKHVLWTDAFITDKTIDTAIALAPRKAKITYSENTFCPYNRNAILIKDVGQLANVLCNLVSQGKKVVCPVGSKRVGEELAALLVKDCKAKLCLITSGTDDVIKREMENVNAFWVRYDVVIYTATITVGVNFDVPHFDVMCMYTNSITSTVRDMFQGSVRSRILKDDVLYLSIKNDTRFTIGKWGECSRDVLYDTIQNWEGHFFLKTQNRKFIHTLPDWLKNLWVLTQQEINVSYTHHEIMNEQYLKDCGYTTEIGKEILSINTPNVTPKYRRIRDATDEEFKHLEKCVQEQIATEKDKLRLFKYYFSKKVYNGYNRYDWDVYCKGSKTITEKLWNCRHEFGGYAMTDGSIFINNKSQKLHYMNLITAKLGVVHSHDTETEISHENLKATKTWLTENSLTIKMVFGNDKLNPILDLWGFTKIKGGKRIQKRVDGRLVSVTPSKLEVKLIPYKDYNATKEVFINPYENLRVQNPDAYPTQLIIGEPIVV